MLTLTKPEVKHLLLGKNEFSDYLAKIVMDAYGDLKTILMMTTGFRFSYLAGREDRENEYLITKAPVPPALLALMLCYLIYLLLRR